jgi:hypothetical protein
MSANSIAPTVWKKYCCLWGLVLYEFQFYLGYSRSKLGPTWFISVQDSVFQGSVFRGGLLEVSVFPGWVDESHLQFYYSKMRCCWMLLYLSYLIMNRKLRTSFSGTERKKLWCRSLDPKISHKVGGGGFPVIGGAGETKIGGRYRLSKQRRIQKNTIKFRLMPSVVEWNVALKQLLAEFFSGDYM